MLAAIHHRERTGQGQRVDLSLLETVVGWLIHLATDYFATGQLRPGSGTATAASCRTRRSRRSDRYFAFGALNERQFRDFCEACSGTRSGRTIRASSTNADRVAHRAELVGLIEEVLADADGAEWVDALLAVGVPAGRSTASPRCSTIPRCWRANMRIDVQHPKLGTSAMSGISYKHGDTPGTVRPPPADARASTPTRCCASSA